jgi:hypothetical protein
MQNKLTPTILVIVCLQNYYRLLRAPISISCLFALTTSLFLTGCASVEVDPQSVSVKTGLARPAQIYIDTFEQNRGEWKVDREGGELAHFKTKTALDLQNMLVERLRVIAPSSAWQGKRMSGWLVKGNFVRVNQGSRALRMFIGFGAGGTKIETNVRVYDLSQSNRTPILSFATTGGTNAEPGAIVDPLLLPAGTPDSMQGLTVDLKRTAREIRDQLIEELGLNENKLTH